MNQTHLTADEQKASQQKLAVDRTVFAFERTALAYVRTGLTFMIGGVSLIKLFESQTMHVIGWVMFVIAAYFLVLGVIKFAELGSFMEKHES